MTIATIPHPTIPLPDRATIENDPRLGPLRDALAAEADARDAFHTAADAVDDAPSFAAVLAAYEADVDALVRAGKRVTEHPPIEAEHRAKLRLLVSARTRALRDLKRAVEAVDAAALEARDVTRPLLVERAEAAVAEAARAITNARRAVHAAYGTLGSLNRIDAGAIGAAVADPDDPSDLGAARLALSDLTKDVEAEHAPFLQGNAEETAWTTLERVTARLDALLTVRAADPLDHPAVRAAIAGTHDAASARAEAAARVTEADARRLASIPDDAPLGRMPAAR